MKNDIFEIGSWVVYPSHGVGRLESIDKMNIAGSEVEFLVIVFQKNKLVLKIPATKAMQSGLRNVASKDELLPIFEILSTKTTKKRLCGARGCRSIVQKLIQVVCR